MDLYKALVRPLLFTLDAETVHNFALRMVAKGLIKEHRNITYTVLEQEMFGAKFKNPLGLAAGFDKNAVALSHWSAAGFGFVEVGTVTYRPQEGNPRPRIFRVPEEMAIVNRLGFNNLGAAAVASNLANAGSLIPFGINIGKSAATPIENAAEDYVNAWKVLRPYGSYLAINVSSPNTPGLRTLQEKEKLREIVKAIRFIDPLSPLFIKVAPDLEFGALDDVIEVALESRVTGLIATNTTTSLQARGLKQAGGLSGKPLKELSNKVLAYLARQCGNKLFLIGVGGIFTAQDLFDKIAMGAHLCQVYTGWVYNGPEMVPRCLEELATMIERQGFKHMHDLWGSALNL